MTGVQTCALPICFPVTIDEPFISPSLSGAFPVRLISTGSFFNGENDTNYWAEKTEYSTPTCKIGSTKDKGIKNGSLGDYFGLPTGIQNTIKVNALPARAYAMIYNEWFRDENLEAPLMLGYKKTDSAGNTEIPSNFNNSANNPENTADDNEAALYSRKPAKAGKFHDYFTSCLV